MLVPEISLTPQTVERFKARFSHGPQQTLVAVLHSHLSSGERHDEWHKIRQGRARIVIGARSAVFAPVEPLGLVIVDEEHEHSYKQEEAPRYNARDLAVVRGQLEGAAVVLGSATPSMESYYNVQRGKYGLLSLTERVDNINMPLVRVIDMRSIARKEKGISIFSPQLREAILQRLEKKEQVMLFPQPARLVVVVALPRLRLRRRVPELQRVADLPSRRTTIDVPHLWPCRGRAEQVSAGGLRQRGDPVCRPGNGEGRGCSGQGLPDGEGQANGFRHAQAQGGLPAYPRRFSHR